MGLKFRKKIIFYMIEEIKQRLGFYRKMQLWPIANELDFENWLDNFQSKEDKGNYSAPL